VQRRRLPAFEAAVTAGKESAPFLQNIGLKRMKEMSSEIENIWGRVVTQHLSANFPFRAKKSQIIKTQCPDLYFAYKHTKFFKKLSIVFYEIIFTLT
jgi:hypothetical protein